MAMTMIVVEEHDGGDDDDTTPPAVSRLGISRVLGIPFMC